MQKYQNNVTDLTGSAVIGVQVTVTTIGGVLATIYSDNGGTEAPNPLTTDSSGYFQFYAPNGRYDITVPGAGGYTDVLIVDGVETAENALTKDEAAADDGASRVGTPEGTVQDALDGRVRAASLAAAATVPAYAFSAAEAQSIFDNALPKSTYADIISDTSRAKAYRILTPGIAGDWYVDPTDSTSASNNGTILVRADGKRVKRTGVVEVDAAWFGVKADWNGTTGTNNTAAFQMALDWVGQKGGGTVFFTGDCAVDYLVMGYDNVRFIGKSGARLISLQPFTNPSGQNPHRPTVWVSRNNCAVRDMGFTYAGWVEANLASLLSARNFTNPWYGSHIAVGWTSLFNPAGSGIPSVVFGVTTGVVNNVEISGINMLGTACHGIAFFNAVGSKLSNISIRQYKGTGIFGYSAPRSTLSRCSIDIGGDDGIYIGTNASSTYDGYATPIKVSELAGIIIEACQLRRTGAKGIGVAGYNGIVIANNLIDESFVQAIYGTNEIANAPLNANIQITGNTVLGAFGSFGTTADGYFHSASAVASVLGVYHAVELSGTVGATVTGNNVNLSEKISDANQKQYLRLGFGNGNFSSAVIASNKFSSFIRGNIGSEPDTGSAYTTAVKFASNIVDALANAEPAKLITIGAKADTVHLDANTFRSLSPSNGPAWAAVFPLGGSKSLLTRNIFDVPNGLPPYTNTAPTTILMVVDGNFSDVAPTGAIVGASFAGRVFYGAGVPTAGSWTRGDIVFNNLTLVGGISYWECTTTGTPGSWTAKQIGVATSIAAAPTNVGFLAVVGGIGYMSVGTASAADWKQITN